MRQLRRIARRVLQRLRKLAGRVKNLGRKVVRKLSRERKLFPAHWRTLRAMNMIGGSSDSRDVDNDRVIDLLSQAIDLAPNYQRPRILRSQVLMRTGAIEQSIDDALVVTLAKRDAARVNRLRAIQGRYTETHEHWMPTVPGEPLDTAEDEGGQRNRVLYLAKESMPHLNNGYCTRTHETLIALKGAGWDPVAVTQPGFPNRSDVEPMSVVDGVEYHHVLPGAKTHLDRLSLDEFVQLTTSWWARAVRDVRPEIIHAGSGHRGYDFALAGHALSRWAQLPWIYEVRSFFETTWTADERYAESSEYYHRRFASESRVMSYADALVSLSGPMRDEIINVRGMDAERVFVIPNAVDLTRFAPVERTSDLRRKLGWQDKFVLGYVSNLDHYREGQEVLLEGVAKLKAQGHNVACLLVGDGRRRAELEALARKLKLGNDVHFSGNVPFHEVSAYYAEIDLFVIPRVDERAGRLVSPMKPFEAMAMEIPIMVSDLPALKEIVGAHQERGAVFTASDPASLAAEAAQLIKHPERLRNRAAAASRWVRTERSWAANGKAFAEVYAFAKEQAERRMRDGHTVQTIEPAAKEMAHVDHHAGA